MKPLPVLGFVVVAAFLAIALVGTGSAAAEEKSVLCKVFEAGKFCTEENIFPKETKVVATATNPRFKVFDTANPETQVVQNEVVCEKSVVEYETTSANGKGQPQLLGRITGLKFEPNCTVAGVGGTCVITTLQLPYEAQIASMQDSANGTLTVFETSGQPGAHVKCTLFGFLTVVDCTYKVSETDKQVEPNVGHFAITGGAPATIAAEQIAMKEEGPTCPGFHPKWDATYVVETPSPGFVNQIEQ